MNKLSKEQYIGVAVALLLALFMFFGFDGAKKVFNNEGQPADTLSGTTNNDVLDLNEDGDPINNSNNMTDTNKVAESGDTITVHYNGTFENGTKFDSSYDRGQPFSFVLGAGMVIKGWDQGLIGAKEGEKKRLVLPPELAYGAAGQGPIPPNSTLIFEVEVLDIEKPVK